MFENITQIIPEWILWVFAFLIFCLVTTYILKRSGKAKTYYIASMIKTTKFIPWLDKFMVFGRLIDAFARIGLVFGFGAFAVDYMYGRGRKIWIRLPLFLISAGILYFIYENFFLLMLSNPFISEYALHLSLSFAFFGFAGFIVFSLFGYAIYIMTNVAQGTGGQVCPGVAPLIPGVEIPNMPVVVPLHGWLSLLIILILHEGMHGVVLRRVGLKIKSGGLLLLGILPIGAFVEPDEEEVKKAEPIKALKVFAAGPMANLFTMFAVLVLVLVFLIAIQKPMIDPWLNEIKAEGYEGIVVSSVEEEFDFCGDILKAPAFGKLEEGMLLREVNGQKVSSATQAATIISRFKTEEFTLTMEKEDGTTEIFNIKPEGKLNYLGFQIKDKQNEDYIPPEDFELYKAVASPLNSFINWFFILSFLVAIVNFLPLEPFDGGRILKIMVLPYIGFLNLSDEDADKAIRRVSLAIIVLLLLINALPLFL
ncbi:MAG: site-2 protease family protein [Candidatus Diapherotrites archaeon]